MPILIHTEFQEPGQFASLLIYIVGPLAGEIRHRTKEKDVAERHDKEHGIAVQRLQVRNFQSNLILSRLTPYDLTPCPCQAEKDYSRHNSSYGQEDSLITHFNRCQNNNSRGTTDTRPLPESK
jgi:hypothetical protein